MIQPSQAVALITAAGLSSRMGRPKAMLPAGGQTLLEYQCAQLGELDSRWVVLGHAMEQIVLELHGRLPPRTITLNNTEYAAGRGGSIELAACNIRNTLQIYGESSKAPENRIEAILLCGVDQPVDAAVLKAMLARFEPGARQIVQPVYQDRRGHPLLFAVSYIEELCGVSKLPEGLRSLIRSHQERIVLVETDSADVLLDLNTPVEYEAFRARFEQ